MKKMTFIHCIHIRKKNVKKKEIIGEAVSSISIKYLGKIKKWFIKICKIKLIKYDLLYLLYFSFRMERQCWGSTPSKNTACQTNAIELTKFAWLY